MSCSTVRYDIFCQCFNNQLRHQFVQVTRGSLQTTAGIYTDDFSSILGCDSIVTTNLKVMNVYEKTVEASICPGEEYFAGGSLQTKPGTYIDTFFSTLGCDSIIVTNLSLGICTGIESDFDNSVIIY